MALLRPETIAHWHKQKWRLPDYDDGSTAIWYGPDGPQGEYATTIDYDDIYQYAITEFSPDPNNNSNNIVCITVLLSKDDVDETLRVSGVYTTGSNEHLWAVGLGVAEIFYFGGDTSDFCTIPNPGGIPDPGAVTPEKGWKMQDDLDASPMRRALPAWVKTK